MAVDANAMSLATWQKQSNDPLIEKITISLWKQGHVFADIPFKNYKSMKALGARFTGDSMPTINYSDINAAPLVTTSTPVNDQEGAAIVRNFIDIDHLLEDDVNTIGDPFAAQIKNWIAAWVYDSNDKFINNDHLTGNVKATVGLKYRLNNPTQYDIPSSMKLDGAAVDMRLTNMTQITALQFFALIDQLLIQMKAQDGEGVTLYMDAALFIRIQMAAKLAGPGGGLDTTKDEYDRIISTYRAAKLRIIGVKADQTTSIIATEATDGTVYVSGATYTSLYAVKFGTEEAYGWQFEPMRPRYERDSFTTDDAIIRRMLLEYVYGFMFDDTRCIGRIFNIYIKT